MSTAIRVDGISKQYRIGSAQGSFDALREQVTASAHNLRRRNGKATRGGRSIWAVKDVSFEVGTGEIVGLIGRNGAGKTTLLRILSRITSPTAGRAELRGRLRSLLEVGTGFHPELTGRDNIFLNGAILGLRRREITEKFDEIVEFAGVGKFIDTPVKRYSSGMYVRLAFSVAAHLEPEILLVDEVLAVGDAEFQKRCLGKMESIGQSGRTVVLVSHSMPTITRLCDRAILLEGGRLAADGSADQVVARYLQLEHGREAAREWSVDEAPGDDVVRLRGARIVDAAQRSIDSVDVREEVGIELSFDVLGGTTPFVPWIALYNDQGAHVFSAYDTDPAWERPRAPGRYGATAWIPSNLLNEGTILVSISLSTFASGGKATRHATAEEALVFQVYDRGEGDTARGHYAGNWSAPVRPLLRWDTRTERL